MKIVDIEFDFDCPEGCERCCNNTADYHIINKDSKIAVCEECLTKEEALKIIKKTKK